MHTHGRQRTELSLRVFVQTHGQQRTELSTLPAARAGDRDRERGLRGGGHAPLDLPRAGRGAAPPGGRRREPPPPAAARAARRGRAGAAPPLIRANLSHADHRVSPHSLTHTLTRAQVLGALTPQLAHIVRTTRIGEREDSAVLRAALTRAEEAAAPQEVECARLGGRLRHVTQQVTAIARGRC